LKKLLLVLFLGFSISLGFIGCSNESSKVKITPSSTVTQSTTATPDSNINLTLTKETYPKVDGSTATIPLSVSYAAKLTGMTQDDANKFIKHNTTHNAYVNLIEKKADIIFVTEPSKDELEYAKSKNIELSVIPVVKDAFVFLVNSKNKINSLTADQIKGIYSGKIKNYKEVGGGDQEILAYQRVQNSGSQTAMENLVMKGLKMADAPKELIPAEMDELIEKISSFDNSDRAIGYSFYYYAKKMYAKDNVKILAVNNIKPDNASVQKGEYPFSTNYFAVTRIGEKEDSSCKKLLNWTLSQQGQSIAAEAGYIPLK
jgi:phosphate transport system substrate-binding protein